MSSITDRDGFRDFDDQEIYDDSQVRAVQQKTRNFVVEFGKDGAQIAFDMESEGVESLLKEGRTIERPVRWINIWAPNQQKDLVRLIGEHYKFSARLLAIILTEPPGLGETSRPDKRAGKIKTKLYQKDDVELAASGLATPKLDSSTPARTPPAEATHYTIARQMVHYQSVDGGAKFLCIGANWTHENKRGKKSDGNISPEGQPQQLWSWLVLCDDNTVISLHEDPGKVDNTDDMKLLRANTISVLSQLSKRGHDSADPISMQTVRQALDLDASEGDAGVEGSSNLFYYLFDDWRAVYTTVAGFQTGLNELQTAIVGDIGRKSHKQANIEIIPRLHDLGREIRRMEHLYRGYKNLISRILEQKATGGHGLTTPRSLSGFTHSHRGVVFAQSALQRFERLGDRIQFLILSQTQEFLAEKDALISTYFNITAQKDSEATARLTRAATLLAKLSVLFLPVSLMTGYFSVQIQELEGVYTTKDYWYSFAIIMTVSVLGLFFFAKALMWITETLDLKVKQASKAVRRPFVERLRRKDADREKEHEG